VECFYVGPDKYCSLHIPLAVSLLRAEDSPNVENGVLKLVRLDSGTIRGIMGKEARLVARSCCGSRGIGRRKDHGSQRVGARMKGTTGVSYWRKGQLCTGRTVELCTSKAKGEGRDLVDDEDAMLHIASLFAFRQQLQLLFLIGAQSCATPRIWRSRDVNFISGGQKR
jgi:hypothetical protein